VLQCGVGGQYGVVWLNNGYGDLWCWVDGKLQFGLLAVVDGETLHEEGSETRSGTTTEGVEEKESLETSALIDKLTDTVKDKVDEFLSDGVVTTGVVVGGIFLTSDELLGME
jgi:hypothetical protein